MLWCMVGVMVKTLQIGVLIIMTNTAAADQDVENFEKAT